jgi:ABC-type metal ion transport system substrate-binding protein
VLLGLKANVNYKDIEQLTPAQLARHYNNGEIASIIENYAKNKKNERERRKKMKEERDRQERQKAQALEDQKKKEAMEAK